MLRAYRLMAGLGVALAAGACGTVELGPPPADVNACRPSQRYFVEKVWPEFLAREYGGKRCNDARCHDAGSSRELVLAPPSSEPTLPLPPDWAVIYKAVTEQMLCTNAAASPLITRPSSASHGGGKLIELDGPEAMLVAAWVTAP